MPPALIGGVIAAGATIGGAVISSKANKKAVNQATQAQQQSEAAQLGYQREADARNLAALSPFMTRGNVAGDTIMSALGVGTTVPQPNQPTGASGTIPGTPTPGVPSALNAYELFKNSVGYQSRLQEGQRAQGALYSARGVFQSGARDKALARFNQDYASREFGNWLGYLGNQQSLGLAGASALAGVSQGSADRMGAISQNSADFATQAAIARAQNQGALYTGIAGAVGQVAGALSSYKPKAAYP